MILVPLYDTLKMEMIREIGKISRLLLTYIALLPNTNYMASMTLDLPLPLGPIMLVKL